MWSENENDDVVGSMKGKGILAAFRSIIALVIHGSKMQLLIEGQPGKPYVIAKLNLGHQVQCFDANLGTVLIITAVKPRGFTD